MLLVSSIAAFAPGRSWGQGLHRRVALVIGNGEYTYGDNVLQNPANDAQALAAKLKDLNFIVTSGVNLNQDQMRELISTFVDSIRDGDFVLIYYAGHGIESGDQDYMLPVDVKLHSANALNFWGIPLKLVYPPSVRTSGEVIIFDACRDNPFIHNAHGSVAGAHGASPPSGSEIIFSTSAGDTADDGAAGGDGASKNSVFLSALLEAISVPNESLDHVYQLTLKKVKLATSNRQFPSRFGGLEDDFIFNPSSTVASASASTAPAPVYAPTPALPAVQEPARMGLAANGQPVPSPAPASQSARSVNVSIAAEPVSQAEAPAASLPEPPSPVDPARSVAHEPSQMLATNTIHPVERLVPKPQPPASDVPPMQGPAPVASPAPTLASPAPLRPLADVSAPATSTTGVEVVTASAPSPPSSPAPVMNFTIASLGPKVLPQPPVLASIPPLKLPERFCSAVEMNDYLEKVFRPAYELTQKNNALANAYQAGLNVLHDEYRRLNNPEYNSFDSDISERALQYESISRQTYQFSSDFLSFDTKIRAIPVTPCVTAKK